jgi:hypothetical protein
MLVVSIARVVYNILQDRLVEQCPGRDNYEMDFFPNELGRHRDTQLLPLWPTGDIEATSFHTQEDSKLKFRRMEPRRNVRGVIGQPGSS